VRSQRTPAAQRRWAGAVLAPLEAAERSLHGGGLRMPVDMPVQPDSPQPPAESRSHTSGSRTLSRAAASDRDG